MEIIGITMKQDTMVRVLVKADSFMQEAIIKKFNDMEQVPVTTLEELNNRGYGSGEYLEIAVDRKDASYTPIYFYDSYVALNFTIPLDAKRELDQFVCDWMDKLPDNKELLLGDEEWLFAIPDNIPWKYRLTA